ERQAHLRQPEEARQEEQPKHLIALSVERFRALIEARREEGRRRQDEDAVLCEQRVDYRARFLAKGLRRLPLLFRDRRRIGETLGDPWPEARATLLDPG